jgi:hypothetical protein
MILLRFDRVYTSCLQFIEIRNTIEKWKSAKNVKQLFLQNLFSNPFGKDTKTFPVRIVKHSMNLILRID